MRGLLLLLTASALAAVPLRAAAPRVSLLNARPAAPATPPGLTLPPASLLAVPALPAGPGLSPASRLAAPALPAGGPRLSPEGVPTPAPSLPPLSLLPASQAPGPARDTPAEAPAARRALDEGAALAEGAPSDIGRLYDAAPAAPDFAELSPVVEPPAPRPWRPSWTMLKPAAGLVNAWRSAAHERRARNAGPEQRVTMEETGLRESLTGVHAALREGRLQAALDPLSEHFDGAAAKEWFRANGGFGPYREQAMVYYRFAEVVLLRAYARSHRRASDAGLIAEARAASRDGSLLGRGYRATPPQEKDSGHCALHAMFNAITAAAGFVYPLPVHEFVENARSMLNAMPSFHNTGRRGIAQMEKELGLKFGRNVDEGLGDKDMARYAGALGLPMRTVAAPASDAGWRELLGGREQAVLSLRMFHPRFRLDKRDAALEGHEYRMLHHAVHLLGAFPSPSRGVWLYMVQDSGSGVTAFHTAEELTALTRDVQLIDASLPARLPRAGTR